MKRPKKASVDPYIAAANEKAARTAAHGGEARAISDKEKAALDNASAIADKYITRDGKVPRNAKR